MRVMCIRMGSQFIIQVLRIMWHRLRLTGSSQIAIMTLVAVADSVVIAMGSVMVVIDYRMESVADIRMARLETAAAEGIALRRHHSSHQTLAAVLF